MLPQLNYLPETPSQTAGPYVHIGLIPHQAGFDIFANNFGGDIAGPDIIGERIVTVEDAAELRIDRPHVARLEARGASLVALSPQTAANSRRSQRENSLGFPILSDAGGEVSAQFGVRWTVPGYLRDIHKQLGADLTQFNGEDSWTLPMPARYVIGQDGVIAYAEVNPDYTLRPEPEAMLPALKKVARVAA